MPTGEADTTNSKTNPFDSVLRAAYAVYITRLKSFKDQTYSDLSDKIYLETVMKIEIQDSMDMYFRTAKVWFSDRYSIREIMPLTGNEIITIKYKNLMQPSATNEKVIHFQIQSISEVPNLQEYNKGSNITLMNLVEAPAFSFLTNNCVYKTYPWDTKMKVSDLVNDCLLSVPGLRNWYDIDIEETSNAEGAKFNFYNPNWTPMKTINYLKKFAISQKDDFPYYTFFIEPPKTKSGKPTINFKPVYKYMTSKASHKVSSHFQQEVYRTPEGEKNAPVRDFSKENDYDIFNTMQSRQFDYFHRAKTAFAQLSGETFFTFDYVNDNKYFGMDYATFKATYRGLGQKQLHSMNYGNQWASQRPHSFTDNLRLLNMKRNEMAYNTIHSGIACTAEMVVNNHRNVGHLADMLFKTSLNQKSGVDYMMSGLWLIWGQVDEMRDGGARSKVLMVKDGFEQLMVNPNLPPMTHLNPPIEASKIKSQS
jgi:hypothetical protein